MQQYEISGTMYEFDNDGFLQDFKQWNQAVAMEIARRESVSELTEEHWKVINFLRQYFVQNGVAPLPRQLARETGFNAEKIKQLFPTGVVDGACKVAGLPRPTWQTYGDRLNPQAREG
jgi:tRNA 2-thiouridine synthesizing protein E